MSDAETRHAQADELIRALQRNTVAVGALAAAVGALVLAVERNTAAMDEIEDDEHDEDCDDEDCDGECLEERPRKRRRG